MLLAPLPVHTGHFCRAEAELKLNISADCATWTALHLEPRLDGGDGGDDGSVWHDGAIHVNLLGRGERGAQQQGIVGTGGLLGLQQLQLRNVEVKRKNDSMEDKNK